METIEEEEKEEESQNEKININKIERNLQRRRQIKLAAILLGFVLSLVLLTYSVLVDVNNKKNVSMLEEIICSENDDHCLSLLCPVSMRLNPDTQRCETERDVALAGVGQHQGDVQRGLCVGPVEGTMSEKKLI